MFFNSKNVQRWLFPYIYNMFSEQHARLNVRIVLAFGFRYNHLFLHLCFNLHLIVLYILVFDLIRCFHATRTCICIGVCLMFVYQIRRFQTNAGRKRKFCSGIHLRLVVKMLSHHRDSYKYILVCMTP